MNDKYSFSLDTVFTPGIIPEKSISSPAFWFIFHGEELLVSINDNHSPTVCTVPPDKLGIPVLYSQYLGRYGSTDCFVAEALNSTTPSSSLQYRGMRTLFGRVADDLFTLAGRALQIVHYHREHKFCGRCGTAMKNRASELAKICPTCSFISFPRLSPAVIMSVVRDDRILLGRASRFPSGMYSTLAGFVEPGETLEEAVSREVREEVSLEIKNIRYIASQPWPFPHSLMIGFTAEYASGKITIDNDEIEDAQWFAADTLPRLPSKITIARLLIDNFIESTS
ncbi:MAG: NAD(+) diphosphatase [Desulforhopalus sp.]